MLLKKHSDKILKKYIRKHYNMKKCGIYNINGIVGESSIIIKPVGIIELDQNAHIPDIKIKEYNIDISQIDNNNNNDNEYDDYDDSGIKGEIFLCNILDNYLLSTKKLPIMYVSVVLNKIIQKILLFKIFLYFTIESTINNSDDLINNKLYGKFSIEVVINDKHKVLIDSIDSYLGLEKTIEILEKFTISKNMLSIINDLACETSILFNQMIK